MSEIDVVELVQELRDSMVSHIHRHPLAPNEELAEKAADATRYTWEGIFSWATMYRLAVVDADAARAFVLEHADGEDDIDRPYDRDTNRYTICGNCSRKSGCRLRDPRLDRPRDPFKGLYRRKAWTL